MIAWTSFAVFMASILPYALMTGKPTRVCDIVVRGWSDVNGYVIAYQCVMMLLVGFGVFGLRSTWRQSRRESEQLSGISEREWVIRANDHERTLIVRGFGIADVARQITILTQEPASKRVVAVLPSVEARILLDGAFVSAEESRDIEWDDNLKDGFRVQIAPGREPTVAARVARSRAARRGSEYQLTIRLFGDPNPPQDLFISWTENSVFDGLTPSGPTRR